MQVMHVRLIDYLMKYYNTRKIIRFKHTSKYVKLIALRCGFLSFAGVFFFEQMLNFNRIFNCELVVNSGSNCVCSI